MPYINKAATVFGSYTWAFVVLFGIDLSLLFTIGFGSVADWMMLLVLGLISIPFLITQFGRHVWNSLKSTRYETEEAEDGLNS